MKYQDIAAQATEIASKYIENGWIFAPREMAGSQTGIEFAITLQKPGNSDILAIILKRLGTFTDEGMELRIEFYETEAAGFNECHALWFGQDKGTVVDRWYKVDRDWFVTEDEFKEAHGKKLDRLVRSGKYIPWYKVFRSDNAKQVALNILKKVPGYKRGIKVDDIECLRKEKNGSWIVIVWKKGHREFVNVSNVISSAA